MKCSIVAAVLFAAALPLPALSVEAHHQGTAATALDAGPRADGEVRRVDKDAKKITIKHGPIANLDMPPMTMVFQVKDPALLEQVKSGDKVKFSAEKAGGAYYVTGIEAVR